jgi:hypothetical protein
LQACVSDCRAIFSEDGEVDNRALRELESLECSELVSYIEGDSGRAPGEALSPETPGEALSPETPGEAATSELR